MNDFLRYLRSFLRVKPDFVRLLNAVFAVLVTFNVIDITAEQFGTVVLAIEALFQYLSQIAFEKDVDELYNLRTQVWPADQV